MDTDFQLHGDDTPPTYNWSTTDDPTATTEDPTSPRPWFMAVSLRCRPRCFGCGGRMLTKVVVVQFDFAICEQCSTTDWSAYRPLWRALESLGSPLELSRSRGITFWTPPTTLPDIDGYLRWLELHDIMRHRAIAPTTPTGVQS